MTAPALSVSGLTKTYKGRGGAPVEALKNVSLDVAQGEFFALLGPNGAGKTSLIAILTGLASKSGGTASVCGNDIDSAAAAAKACIGVVPQEFNFNIFETVENIVVDQAGYYGIPREVAIPRAKVLLTELGLWEKRAAQAQQLSGGMKRRLMIARALVHEPRVLLLDEPTAGVDVELRRSMWDFLRALNAGGTTILLTTHYLEEAEQLCSRVAIMNKGVIINQGSVRELLTQLKATTVLLDTGELLTEAVMQLLRDTGLTRVDERTLSLTLTAGQSLNESVRKLTSIGVTVVGVRSAGSRLEELFLQVIDAS